MKKHDWILIIAPILLIIGLDQSSKMWALSELRVFGQWLNPYVGFFLHKNHGAMLGTFSELPPVLRVVSLSTGGVFLIFIFSVIMKLLQHRLLRLRIGMSILLGGILGNVIDRIFQGPVTDFIVFRAFETFSPAFNIADAVQWLGYGLVSYSIIKDGHLIWPDDNKRNQFWVDKKYQLKYCLTFVGFSAVFSLILGVLSFTFMKVMVDESIRSTSPINAHVLIPFVAIFTMVSVAFAITLFLLGLRLSHRSVGPVYAFRCYIEDLRAGKIRPFQLRSHDEFKYLEYDAKALSKDYIEYNKLKQSLEIDENAALKWASSSLISEEHDDKEHQIPDHEFEFQTNKSEVANNVISLSDSKLKRELDFEATDEQKKKTES